VEVHPGGLVTAPIGLVSLMGAFLFLGIGLASKHDEFELVGEWRFFHNGTSLHVVQEIIFSTPYL
jgi:hypothetical protein